MASNTLEKVLLDRMQNNKSSDERQAPALAHPNNTDGPVNDPQWWNKLFFGTK